MKKSLLTLASIIMAINLFAQFQTEITVTPDSIVQYRTYENGDSIPYRKTIFTFDQEQNLYTKILQKWTQDKWQNYSKFVEQYNSNDSLILEAEYEWSNKYSWLGWSKTEYTFNDSIFDKVEIEYHATTSLENDSDWHWSRDWKREILIETVNGNTVKTTYLYNIFIGWSQFYKYIVVHDSKGNLIWEGQIDWDNDDWENYEGARKEYSYDEENNLVLKVEIDLGGNLLKTETDYDWQNKTIITINSFYNTEWKLSSKEEQILNDSFYPILIKNYVYDKKTDEWILDSQVENEYDKNNNHIKRITQGRKDNSDTLVNGVKTIAAYDDLGRIINDEHYRWDDQLSYWKGSFKTLYEYPMNGLQVFHTGYMWDSNGNWQEMVRFKTFYDTENKILLKTTENYNINGQNWYMFEKSFYYYPLIQGLSGNILVSDINIYPNPVSDDLFIFGNDSPTAIQIFNTDGKMVLRKPVNNQHVMVHELPIGTYIIRILKDKQILKTEKIIKL